MSITSAAEVLRQEDLLAVTLASIGDGVIVVDSQGRVVFLNGEAERLTGWSSREAEGQPLLAVFRIINEHTRRPVENPVEKVLRLGTVVGLANHTILVAKDGREIPIDDSGAPIRQSDGTMRGVVLVFRDFTEQKKVEKSLARLAAIVECSDDAIISKNLDGIIQTWNAAAERLFGYSTEKAVGQPIKLLIPSERIQEEDQILERVRNGQRVDHLETVRVAKDGRRIDVSITVSPVKDHDGQIIGVSKIIRDITDRKQVEGALRESENRFRTMANAVPQLAWIAKADGYIYWYNQRWYDYTGTTPEQMQGWGWQSVHDPEVLPKVMDQWRASIATGEQFDMIFPLRGADGVFRPFLTRVMPLKDEQGRVQQWFGTNTDVSEQKRTEEELARSMAETQRQKDLLAVTLTSIGDGVIVTDAQGRVTFLNGEAERLTGWTSREAEGHPLPDVFHIINEDTRQPVENPVEKVFRLGTVVGLANHTILVAKDGREISIDDSGAPICPSDGTVQGVVLVFRDFTVQKKAAEARRASEEQFRRAIEDAPIPIIMHAENGQVLQISRTWTELTGYALADVPTLDAWLNRAYGEGADAVRTQMHALFVGSARTISIDFPVRTRNGQIRHWNFNASLPGTLQDGRRFVVGMAVDITERKRMEEALRETKAAAEAANEAKGRFLANISHELRTPMNAILGMVDLALPKQVDPTATDLLTTAKGSADLLLALLNDLLDSAKIEAGKLELESVPFSLRRVMDQTTQVLSVRASEQGISFSCRISPEVPDALVGDQVRLRQIFLNLAGNGIKFTEKGEVTISVRVESQEAEEARLEFAVRDTGIGIPQADMEGIFQPFAQADVSTTRRFGGTGLGLTICSSLVGMMGGRIWAESEVGHGSTFYFTVRLPLAKELPPEPEKPDIPAAATSRLRILLAEDNPANQKLVTYILKDRGHCIDVIGDGQQAIRMAQENRHDIILMDVQMPGMDGLEATKAIRAQEGGQRRVPIIAMTAHAMKGDRERCLAAGMNGYLSKPIDGHEMIALVESLAAGGTPPTVPIAATNFPAAVVFDPGLALKQCGNSHEMVGEMIRCFFDDVDGLFPKMRSALQLGDLAAVGRLGHRLKGTVLYLGAESAQEAAHRVEQFCESSGGTPSRAEEAVDVLEHECMVLKAVLREHSLAAEPKQDG